MTEKPFILRLDEGKAEIIATINKVVSEQHIPMYILEYIIGDIYNSVKNGASVERREASLQFKKEE